MKSEKHEPDRVAGRFIAKVGVGAVLIGFVGVGAAKALLPRAAVETPRPAPSVIGSLEQSRILDGDRGRHIQAAQRAELDTWHWVDRDAGVVDRPIELAIDALLEGGAP